MWLSVLRLLRAVSLSPFFFFFCAVVKDWRMLGSRVTKWRHDKQRQTQRTEVNDREGE